jgi:hypothetical protein
LNSSISKEEQGKRKMVEQNGLNGDGDPINAIIDKLLR